MDETAIPRIAVVDDEAGLRETLTVALRREGWAVETHADGASALDALQQRLPDALILDIVLPRLDGLDVLRRLRGGAGAQLPILLLSSRSEEFDRVLGLELGADDYLTKPFSVRELVARVRALLRRTGSAVAESAAPGRGQTITCGELALDLERLRAFRGAEALDLTVTEFLLLVELARRPGRVRTRRQLLDAAVPEQRFVADRTVDSHVKRLRRKLRDAGLEDPVEAVYGVGYRLREDLPGSAGAREVPD
jgi:DNA-binding response OmpR family regulator